VYFSIDISIVFLSIYTYKISGKECLERSGTAQDPISAAGNPLKMAGHGIKVVCRKL
jgi:hypothetical protein